MAHAGAAPRSEGATKYNVRDYQNPDAGAADQPRTKAVNGKMPLPQAYNILIIMILKWGSSNILWLAMTIMVPLGNLAFALPFVSLGMVAA